jgi:hypothetical protein
MSKNTDILSILYLYEIKVICYNKFKLNMSLLRVTEGTGPVMSSNLQFCKVLNPAVKPTDEVVIHAARIFRTALFIIANVFY